MAEGRRRRKLARAALYVYVGCALVYATLVLEGHTRIGPIRWKRGEA